MMTRDNIIEFVTQENNVMSDNGIEYPRYIVIPVWMDTILQKYLKLRRRRLARTRKKRLQKGKHEKAKSKRTSRK